MRKGERTRERIIEQTAPLFNQKGYFGSSLSDIMDATGLKKGGIYNHFVSKEELALQAFDYAAACVGERLSLLLAEKRTAVERLLAFAAVFCDLATNPPVPGGCPLLNTAIESDDAHPVLRERVRQAMDRWRERIRNAVQEGLATGEFRQGVDPDVVASRFIATLEGGVMLSRLYRDPVHIHRAVEFLTEYLHRDLCYR
jgi:TetR/AcrR family transcriptional repressor of nem operon